MGVVTYGLACIREKRRLAAMRPASSFLRLGLAASHLPGGRAERCPPPTRYLALQALLQGDSVPLNPSFSFVPWGFTLAWALRDFRLLYSATWRAFPAPRGHAPGQTACFFLSAKKSWYHWILCSILHRYFCRVSISSKTCSRWEVKISSRWSRVSSPWATRSK